MSLIYKSGTFCTVSIKQIKGLHPYQQIIYVWLSHHANQEGVSWPSVRVLAQECGITTRSVTTHLSQLEAKGFLIKENRLSQSNGNLSNSYTIVIKDEPSENELNSPHGDEQYAPTPELNSGPPLNQMRTNYNHIRTITKELKQKNNILCDSLFEKFKSNYPRRAGGMNWKDSERQWTARLKAGVAPKDILEGVERYRKFCEATGKIGTEYVKMPQTFIGRDEHFKELWNIPPNPKIS